MTNYVQLVCWLLLSFANNFQTTKFWQHKVLAMDLNVEKRQILLDKAQNNEKASLCLLNEEHWWKMMFNWFMLHSLAAAGIPSAKLMLVLNWWGLPGIKVHWCAVIKIVINLPKIYHHVKNILIWAIKIRYVNHRIPYSCTTTQSQKMQIKLGWIELNLWSASCVFVACLGPAPPQSHQKSPNFGWAADLNLTC